MRSLSAPWGEPLRENPGFEFDFLIIELGNADDPNSVWFHISRASRDLTGRFTLDRLAERSQHILSTSAAMLHGRPRAVLEAHNAEKRSLASRCAHYRLCLSGRVVDGC
jgi:hypothetical protein